MFSLLLAGVCTLAPLFDMTGVSCPVPTTECRCSECMKWTPVPGALWYDVIRQAGGVGPWVIVGSSTQEGNYADEDGVYVPTNPQELWCFAKDNPHPVEGVSHRYEVRACNISGCSPWSAQTITYVAAPYACYARGVEIACYVGDPLSHP